MHDFHKMTVHELLEYRKKPDLQGNLTEFFEGRFVFVADISTGSSDLGQTPIEDYTPLVVVHASLLNGLLTHSFYAQWSFWKTIGLVCALTVMLGVAALPRSSWFLYLAGGLLLIGIIGLTWHEFIYFRLLPIFTISANYTFIFFSIVIVLQIVMSRQQYFIRQAFSKYVPEKVVNELILHPEQLKLGGEERMVSVLFADVEEFTSISETMSPSDLVRLLNEYLSEMTAIILAQGGIIDKFEGDAIMAEFGAPLALPDHADMAVRAGLLMQRRLGELRQSWMQRGLPLLRCRVGINTGLVIVGNMGSQQVFDYTVLGDAVNLASRLEGVNKLYRTDLMISEFTRAQLSPNLFRMRLVDVVQVKGKSQAVKIFEVYGTDTEEIDAQDLLYYETYHNAFTAYLAKDFASAYEKFAKALSIRPDDPAAHAIVARMNDLNPRELPDAWDGSITLTMK
jgi:adenylate cyclase